MANRWGIDEKDFAAKLLVGPEFSGVRVTARWLGNLAQDHERVE